MAAIFFAFQAARDARERERKRLERAAEARKKAADDAAKKTPTK